MNGQYYNCTIPRTKMDSKKKTVLYQQIGQREVLLPCCLLHSIDVRRTVYIEATELYRHSPAACATWPPPWRAINVNDINLKEARVEAQIEDSGPLYLQQMRQSTSDDQSLIAPYIPTVSKVTVVSAIQR